MKHRIAVIGSNSFSGADFIDLLLENPANQVLGISRSAEKDAIFLPYKRHAAAAYDFRKLDLNDDMPEMLSVLDTFKPEYVVNFAAQSEVAPSWENPWQWFQTNAVAISHLGHHLKSAPYLKRYVHISSPEVYGTCVGSVLESAPLNPSTPYAASKAAGDLFLFTLVKNYKFPMVMIRATNVYGPCQQLHKIIPRAAIYMMTGRTVELHGGGRAVKSYIHIRDVSRGELAAMEKGRGGEIYHLSPDKVVSVRELVEMIAAKMGVVFDKTVKIVAERLGQDAAYVIDSTKARRDLGWKPMISLEEGVGQVIDWVKKNRETIAHQSLEYVHKP